MSAEPHLLFVVRIQQNTWKHLEKIPDTTGTKDSSLHRLLCSFVLLEFNKNTMQMFQRANIWLMLCQCSRWECELTCKHLEAAESNIGTAQRLLYRSFIEPGNSCWAEKVVLKHRSEISLSASFISAPLIPSSLALGDEYASSWTYRDTSNFNHLAVFAFDSRRAEEEEEEEEECRFIPSERRLTLWWSGQLGWIKVEVRRGLQLIYIMKLTPDEKNH